jgi:hypothetical protein
MAFLPFDFLDSRNDHGIHQCRHRGIEPLGQAVKDWDQLLIYFGRIHAHFPSVPTVVAFGFAVWVKDDGVTATIADDRPVASIQNETLAFVLADKLGHRFANLQRRTSALGLLHGNPLSAISLLKDNYRA